MKYGMKLVLAGMLLLSASNAWAEPCQADIDCDKKVGLADLVIMKQEYLRTDCDTCIPAPLPKTGQTICYDTDGNPRDCAGTGEDGQYQMGIASPSPRFKDHGDGTVTDNLTGLMWTKDAQQIPGEVNWQQALDVCDTLIYAGHDDWRLPNRRELQSLIDYENFYPALPPGHPFINEGSGRYYWSSTSNALSPTYAWMIESENGHDIIWSKGDSSDCHARAVRGGH